MMPNNWTMDCEPSKKNFTDCLYQIVSGTSDEIKQGWTNLRQLNEEIREDINLRDIHDMVRMIFGKSIQNVKEVPKLLDYFSTRLRENPFGVKSSGNNYTPFLMNTAGKDINLLSEIVEMLYNHRRIYLSTVMSRQKFCEAVVTYLAEFPMPQNPSEISAFKDSAKAIWKCLLDISQNNNYTIHERQELIFMCLDTLYKIISDVERNSLPGDALVGVLEMIDKDNIKKAVACYPLDNSLDDNLERALKTLCIWMSHWLKHQSLSLWISAFMSGLEEKRKYSVLRNVSEACLKTMIERLTIPLARQHSMAVVYLMLTKQHTPTLFHRVMDDIKKILLVLQEDHSEGAKKCTQSLVDCSSALMKRFPNYPMYEAFEKCLPVEPRANVIEMILTSSEWVDDTMDDVQNIVIMNNGKVGLTNLGNTCYVNSVLQALVMTRQFCHDVISYKPPSDNNANVILTKLQNLFALLLYSKRHSLSPNEVLQAARPSYFTPGQQQDSSEFLCYLLDVLYEQEKSHLPQQDDLELKILKAGTEEQDEQAEDMVVDADGCGIKRWTTEEDLTEGAILERKTQSLADFSDGEELPQTQQLSDSHSDSTDSGIQSVGGEDPLIPNIVHRVFGGESEITYQCTQCDTSSHNTDKFRDLQLCFPEEILENQEVSVQDLINYYLTPEKLTGDNKYRCDKCMELCDAQRIIKLLRAPAHLILTLKHFSYDPETRLRTKLRHKVTYSERIQLQVSTQLSTELETYQLYAAVVHSGHSMDYGHYFTYASDAKKDWYKFNDSFVSKTTLDELRNLESPDTPYILFYEKITKTDGSYEEDMPELTALSEHIRDLVDKDNAAYCDELRRQEERKKNRNRFTQLKKNNQPDDDNPPPSNCRAAIGMPANPFLF